MLTVVHTSGSDQQPVWDVRALRPAEVDLVASVLGLARLHQGDGSYLVAWVGDAPLGHVHVASTDPPELQDLEVRPSHRRRGIATGLVAAAEKWVRARGAHELRLEVSTAESATQDLYRKCGYVDAGLPVRRVKGRIVVRTGTIEVDDTLMVMTKWLG